MFEVAELIFPIFALIAIGYGATKTPVFNAAAGKALSNFVFWFAIPVMLFRSVAESDPPAEDASLLLLGYYFSTAFVYVLAFCTTRFVLQRSFAESAMIGFASAFSNTVLLGIPVVLTVVGPAAAFPMFLIISFHTVIFFGALVVLMEIGQGSGETWLGLGRRVTTSLASNPIVLSLLLGVLFNRMGWQLPGPIDGVAELLGRAAVPCALFATGAGLSEFSIRGALPRASMILAFKALIHPLVAYVVCGVILGLPPLWTLVAVLLATMPVGVNPYIFATRYRVAEAEIATAVAISTPFAAVAITVVLLLLS